MYELAFHDSRYYGHINERQLVYDNGLDEPISSFGVSRLLTCVIDTPFFLNIRLYDSTLPDLNMNVLGCLHIPLKLAEFRPLCQSGAYISNMLL